MRFVTQETVRAPPSGHAIGISGSTGAAGEGGFESEEVEVDAVEKKSSSEEGGAGAGGEESMADVWWRRRNLLILVLIASGEGTKSQNRKIDLLINFVNTIFYSF